MGVIVDTFAWGMLQMQPQLDNSLPRTASINVGAQGIPSDSEAVTPDMARKREAIRRRMQGISDGQIRAALARADAYRQGTDNGVS